MSPTLATLLKDPTYRSYFLRAPQLPARLYHQAPYYVWAIKADGKWAGVAVPDFPTAFAKTKAILKATPNRFKDVSISSRVVGFRAPEQLVQAYRADGYDWCIMCRRPVHFAPKRRHHALRDDLHRYFSHQPVCPYCGIREETMTHGSITIGKN
jgi:hypothetical protein